MKIVWSPLAIQRVLEAADYIARDKPDAAHRWADATFHAVERLADFPESGRIVPEIGRREVRELIHGAYRVVYRIEEGRVFVLTVRHGSRRFDTRELNSHSEIASLRRVAPALPVGHDAGREVARLFGP